MMIRKYVFRIILCLCLPTTLFAQQVKNELVLSLNAGYSAIGNTVAFAVDKLTDDKTLQIQSIPVLMAHVDFGLGARVSLGAMGSFQTYDAHFNYKEDSGTVPVDLYAKFIYVGLKANVHYLHNPKLDLYSGIRVGFSSRNIESDNLKVFNNSEIIDLLDGKGLKLGLTVLGARYYFGNVFGINSEISLGSPFFISGGISLRF